MLHTIIGGQIIGKVAAINNVGPDGEQGGSFSLYGTILGTSANGHLFRLGKSSHTITIVGGNAESEGGLLTTPITIINDSPLVSIIGGSYLFGDPPAGGYTVLWDATGGKLVISGVNLATPNGAKWRFPSAGFSEVIIRDSDLTTNSIEYNNKVVIEGVREHAGIHHFNNENIVNLGEGALVIKESSGGFTGPRFFDNTDTTPSVQGWDYFEANFPNPITITNFDDGFVGKEFVLYSHTDNSVIKHDANGPGVGPIRLSTGKDYKMPARSIMRFRMIGIPFGSIWVNEP
ncbi:hypothetical protein HYW99_00450 [Candidatus Woesearchaeota archaeon]|nr:hypothetical protein [Candidatus Woesearchaeota archaeon]